MWKVTLSLFSWNYYKGSHMGMYSHHWKVPLLALILLAATASARRGVQHNAFPCKNTSYWNETLQKCIECKVCDDITLRPCESHQDALCGTVADLNIDWSWIRNPHKAKHNRPEEKPPHYVELPKSWQETIREHDPQHHILRQTDDVGVLPLDELGRKTQNFGDDYILPKDLNKDEHHKKKGKGHHKKGNHHHHHTTTTTTPSPDDYDDYDDDYLDDPVPSSTAAPKELLKTSGTTLPVGTSTTKKEETPTTKAPLRLVYKIPPNQRDVFYDYTVGNDVNPENPSVPMRRVPPPEEPFSSVEALVWDWQAVVLVSAIATCILFFIIVVVYTCYYAQQWRKIKKTFDSDMEELSLRLNLINGMGLEHLQDSSIPPSKTLHLAHLIAQKQQEAVVNAALPGTIRPNMNLYSTATSIKKNNT